KWVPTAPPRGGGGGRPDDLGQQPTLLCHDNILSFCAMLASELLLNRSRSPAAPARSDQTPYEDWPMNEVASLPAPVKTPISIAGFKDIYQVPRVEQALNDLQDLGSGANEALRATYVRMIKFGGQRFAIKP